MARSKEHTPTPVKKPPLRIEAIQKVVSTFGEDPELTYATIVNTINARDIAVTLKRRTALNLAILGITEEYATYWQERHPNTEEQSVWENSNLVAERFGAQDVVSILLQSNRKALEELYLSCPLTKERYSIVRAHLNKLIDFGKLFLVDDGKDKRNLFLLKYVWALKLPPDQSLALLEEALIEYRQVNPIKYLQPPNGKPDFSRRYPFIDYGNNFGVAVVAAASNSILLEKYSEAATLLAEAGDSLTKSINGLDQPKKHSGFDYDRRLATAYANQILLNLTQIHLSLAIKDPVLPSHLDLVCDNFIRTKQLLETTQLNTGYVKDLHEYILPALITRYLHTLHLLQHLPQHSPDRFTDLAQDFGINGTTLPELISSATNLAKLHSDSENVAELTHLSRIVKRLSRLDHPPSSRRVSLD